MARPSAATLNAADLLFRTLRLHPSAGRDALDSAWTGVDVTGLTELIVFERCALWLQRRLAEVGAVDSLPRGLSQWLRRAAREEAARNLLVDSQTEELVRLARETGTPFVLLKGAARRAAAASFPCADARATNDVDVLVPSSHAQTLWDALAARGYQSSGLRLSPHHLPMLLGPIRVAIEIHESTAHGLDPRLAWERHTVGGRTVTWRGMEVPIPSATELLWHGLTHAVHQRVGAYRLRYFLDAASILAGDEQLDWGAITTRIEAGEAGEPQRVRSWLDGAATMSGRALPEQAASRRPFDVRQALRWRLAVLRRWPMESALGNRLLEEGTRVAAGLPLEPPARNRGPLRGARRRAGSMVARAAFTAWRVALDR